MRRIELLHTSDPYTELRSGDLGTIISERIDPFGDTVVRVSWDNGSSLSLISSADSWRELPAE